MVAATFAFALFSVFLFGVAKAKDWAGALKLQIEDYTEAAANVPYAVARTGSPEVLTRRT